jgi:hypothetical protein
MFCPWRGHEDKAITGLQEEEKEITLFKPSKGLSDPTSRRLYSTMKKKKCPAKCTSSYLKEEPKPYICD